MNADQFIEALGETETDNNWKTSIGNRDYHLMGDGGRAFSRHQCHPDWVCWGAQKFLLFAHVGETWDHWIERLVRQFFEHETAMGLTAEQIAAYFHVGHPVSPSDADWPKDYVERFRQAVGKLTPA